MRPSHISIHPPFSFSSMHEYSIHVCISLSVRERNSSRDSMTGGGRTLRSRWDREGMRNAAGRFPCPSFWHWRLSLSNNARAGRHFSLSPSLGNYFCPPPSLAKQQQHGHSSSTNPLRVLLRGAVTRRWRSPCVCNIPLIF